MKSKQNGKGGVISWESPRAVSKSRSGQRKRSLRGKGTLRRSHWGPPRAGRGPGPTENKMFSQKAENILLSQLTVRPSGAETSCRKLPPVRGDHQTKIQTEQIDQEGKKRTIVQQRQSFPMSSRAERRRERITFT